MDESERSIPPGEQPQVSNEPTKTSRHWILQGVIDVFKSMFTGQGEQSNSDVPIEEINQLTQEYPQKDDPAQNVPKKDFMDKIWPLKKTD